MFYENYCDKSAGKEIKCSKIFRPWDNSKCCSSKREENFQDSTVSTTTTEDMVKKENIQVLENIKKNMQAKENLQKNLKVKNLDKALIVKENESEKIKPISELFSDNTEGEFVYSVRKSEAKSFNSENIGHKELFSVRSEEISRSFKIPDIGFGSTKHEENKRKINSLNQSIPFEGYPYSPEILHANLAQSLGLNVSDPYLLESLSHGCTIEEYARVLTQDQQAKLLNNRKQRPKKYKCPHCNVGFSNNGQLKGHIRIHTGKNFQ